MTFNTAFEEAAKTPMSNNEHKREKTNPEIVYFANEARFGGEHSARLITRVSKHHLIYSLTGLGLGLACVVGGVVLFFAGVTGKMNWTIKFFGASSNILDAAPGALLFIVGLFIVYVTRYRIRSKR